MLDYYDLDSSLHPAELRRTQDPLLNDLLLGLHRPLPVEFLLRQLLPRCLQVSLDHRLIGRSWP